MGVIREAPVLDWQGCYGGSLKGAIDDGAFCHPGKFSARLIRRIYSHGLEMGYWQEGDLVADPFAGVGIGGIYAASYGLRWIGVELEAKFVELAEKNFALHKDTWAAMGKPFPVIRQGDSREFSVMVAEAVGGIVTSPPYITGAWGGQSQSVPRELREFAGYGEENGQIGRMGEGSNEGVVDSIVTSPPYISGGQHADQTGAWGGQRQSVPRELAGYGKENGQIGRMGEGSHEGVVDSIVTSPPYGRDIEPHRAKPMEEWNGTGKWAGPNSVVMAQGYGQAEGQLGNLPDGDTDGQIGQEQGETYWSACAQVYAECYSVLKPGGVMAVVVKDYVRDGILIPLCDQTLELLCAIGFKPLERVRAWLVVSEYETTLFDDATEREFYEQEEAEHRQKWEERAARLRGEGKKVLAYRPYDFDGWLAAWRQKKRASFFRRDHEKKGTPSVDYEQVLFVEKPQGGR